MNFQDQLPLVGAKDPLSSWVSTVQAAIINTRGVFAIADFLEDLKWDNGCKLSRKVLKAYLVPTLHNPWELHPALDFHGGEKESASNMKTVSAKFMERHVDRGLFNIVQANAMDRRDLHLDLGSGFVNALKLTEYFQLGATLRDKLLIVIPGFTLHVFEPKLQAPAHKVEQQYHGGAHSRSTRVFQCRLPGSFELRGQKITYLLAKSFVDESKDERIELIVKSITEPRVNRVLSLPMDTSAQDVKEIIANHVGSWPSDSFWLCIGEGYQKPWKEGTIAERGDISSGTTVYAHLRLRGD